MDLDHADDWMAYESGHLEQYDVEDAPPERLQELEGYGEAQIQVWPGRANNPSGANGKRPAPKPTDELKAILENYFNQRMSNWEAINNRLTAEHGDRYRFNRAAFYRVTKHLGVGTARKSTVTPARLYQLVLNELEKDVARSTGYRGMQHQLAMNGVLVPRHLVYDAMKTFGAEGLAQRRPGAKKLFRSPIYSKGPNEQWSIDGHDKLGFLGIGIYGIRDVYSGRYLALRALPSNRLLANALTVYMSAVEAVQGFPIQIASDRGSEVSTIFARQTAFRITYSNISLDDWPPHIFLKSIRNITIERSWRGVREKVVDTVKVHFESLVLAGIYQRHNAVHNAVLMFLLPPLVQSALDRHVAFFNSYKVRYQKEKNLPSGATRNEIFFEPSRWGGSQCLQNFGEYLPEVQGLAGAAREDASLEWIGADVAELCAQSAASINLIVPLPSFASLPGAFARLVQVVQAAI